MIPALRIRSLNAAPVAEDGQFVLYWMTAYRRGTWNFSLERAVEWAQQLDRPLVILEALRCGYRWASDRLHQFVIEGMAENAAWFARKPVTYYPYLETAAGDGDGLVDTLAQQACVVITDDFPCFFLPRMISRAARRLPVLVESIDSNGLYPMSAAEGQVFTVAHSFRRHLQKTLLPHLHEMPSEDPLAGSRLKRLDTLPAEVLRRWPSADCEPIAARRQSLAHLPIDHSVTMVQQRGGAHQAQKVWRLFRDDPAKFPLYGSRRNEPSEDVSSGLSPYLHFGHISAHQLFTEITRRDGWSPDKVAPKPTGQQRGWWGGSESLDSFLEELIVWREIGFNFCHYRTDYGHFSSLPDWVQQTLTKHAADPRSHLYTLAEFEQSRTHDPLWNAAQRQLVREGRIHNYLRMLWGKKILEWTASPQQALDFMVELNNKYALDGRNPNSYTGIMWVLGRYDRAWGPERPVFGLIRYMSSENTARKLETQTYLRRYS